MSRGFHFSSCELAVVEFFAPVLRFPPGPGVLALLLAAPNLLFSAATFTRSRMRSSILPILPAVATILVAKFCKSSFSAKPASAMPCATAAATILANLSSSMSSSLAGRWWV